MSNLPALNGIMDILKNPGDHFTVKRTKNDKIVATAKTNGIKLSKTLYPTGTIVETKSYRP